MERWRETIPTCIWSDQLKIKTQLMFYKFLLFIQAMKIRLKLQDGMKLCLAKEQIE